MNLPTDLKQSKRSKRQVGDEIEFDDFAAGTMDVRFDMKALDIDENVSQVGT